MSKATGSTRSSVGAESEVGSGSGTCSLMRRVRIWAAAPGPIMSTSRMAEGWPDVPGRAGTVVGPKACWADALASTTAPLPSTIRMGAWFESNRSR